MRELWRRLARHPRLLAGGVAALLAANALHLSVPLFARAVIDHLSQPDYVLQACLGLALVSLLCGCAHYAWRVKLFDLAGRVEVELRSQIHQRALDGAIHSSAGGVMALAGSDVQQVKECLGFGLVTGCNAVFYTTLGVGAMLWLDWELALPVLLLMSLCSLGTYVLIRRNFHLSSQHQGRLDVLVEHAREHLAGIETVRAYAERPRLLEAFGRCSQAVFQCSRARASWESLLGPSVLLAVGTASAILLGWGGSRVLAGTTSVGTLVAFLTYLGQLSWPMIAAGWSFSLLQRGSASMERIGSFLASSGPPPGAPADLLGHSHPNELLSLLDSHGYELLSLFHSHDWIGLAGEVGSGKSTLVRHVLQQAESAAWVPQHAFVFSESVRSNLLLARPQADDEALLQALRLCLLGVVCLDTPARELSGGERQRLCLARALLSGSPLLLVDDAFSALDADTEAALLANLRGLGKKMLLVSQRAKSLQACDWLLVLADGRIAQQGPPAELAYFRELCRFQERFR